MNTAIQTNPMDTINELGLDIRAEFVPFSQSRNAKPDPKPSDRSLNWRVTLTHAGRDVLTTDYSAGIAHCPGYKQGMKWTIHNAELIEFETERGKPGHAFSSMNRVMPKPSSKPILPDTIDVIYSLSMDSDVIDSGGFEDWASGLGYDTDSRKAEAIYRACLDIALKFRNAIGDDGMAKLRDAFTDY